MLKKETQIGIVERDEPEDETPAANSFRMASV